MRQNRYVQIPDVITVHLGGKESAAPDITLPYIDYLKGCAACLICPVWPEQAQRANIYVINSFVLHRVSSGWYRAQGCKFDITASARDDLPFNGGACLFCNTSCLVEELFNNYLARQGSGEPLLAKLCPDDCPEGGEALCQDGAVDMAQKGYTAYDILRKYYGEDIVMIENAPRKGERERFLGTPLNCGAAGEDIRVIKRQLNRIGQNYPDIERLDEGSPSFDLPCERAVRTFQYIFDLPVTGVLDKATWYSIKRTCAAFEQSEALPFEQAAVPAMRPVSFNDPAIDRPQAAAAPENSPADEEMTPGLVLPGRLISGSMPQRVMIPADDTLDSVISDEGVAERAELEGAPGARQPESSAVENAARWSATRQSILEGAPAPENGTLSSIITDRGIASRAEAASPIPGHPVPEPVEPAESPIPDSAPPTESPISDSDVRELEGTLPEGNAVENAARWNAMRQSIMEGAAAEEGAPSQDAENHLLKIGPSVSAPLPAEEDGVDSGYAVQWLRNIYDL